MVWRPQTTFNQGEVSPHMDGLSDPKVYEASCRKLEGAIVSSNGSVEKRNGSTYRGDTAFSTLLVGSSVPPGSPQGDYPGGFVSTAVKFIPFRVGVDTFVLAFEVIANPDWDTSLGWSDGPDSWVGVIRVIKNNVFHTSTDADTYAGTQIWKNRTNSNHPYVWWRDTPPTGQEYYWPANWASLPPGGSTFTKLFGQHNFSAAQLPDVTYFQHEDSVVVCHPNAAPQEVFATTDVDGTKVLDTRMYKAHRRSPEIIRYGDRFAMNITAGGTNGYTLESTRDWFDQEDVGAIYRIGTLSWSASSGNESLNHVTTNSGGVWDDRGGYFVKVTSVSDARKCSVTVISNPSILGQGSPARVYKADYSDPYDWDGPWLKEKATIDYMHTPIGLHHTGGVTVPRSHSEIQVMQTNAGDPAGPSGPTPQDTSGDGYMALSDDTPFHQHSLVGCIIGNRGNNAATAANLTKECYALITPPGGTDPLPGTLTNRAFSNAIIINGDQAPTDSVPGWNTVASADPLVTGRMHNTFPHDSTTIGLFGQSLYRLRRKASTVEYAPMVAWAPRPAAPGDAAADPPYVPTVANGYRNKPCVGDLVSISVGNIEPTSDTNVGDWSVAYNSIPEGHGKVFDTVLRGDIEDLPEVGPWNDPGRWIGGTVHLNGGVFALQRTQAYAGDGWPAWAPGGDETVAWHQARVLVPPTSRNATAKYSLGWSKAVGFPSCGVSHQGRVIFGGFDMAKRVVVGSEPDRPFDFGLGGTSADGFHFLVNDLRGSRVRWLSSGQDLIIGTTTGEFAVTGSPLSAISVGVDRQSAYGSASVRPVIVGTMLMYVQKDRRTIRAMRYNFDNQRYQSKNVTQEHSHFFSSATIEEMVVWEGQEDPVVLVRLSDGEVLACRVNEVDGFMGWSRMKLPLCSALCAARNYTAGVSSSATAVDSFYLAVTDTDKSRIAQYDDTLYLDEAVAMDSVSATTLTFPAGDTHLDGQEVSVVIDGVYRGEKTVTAGTPSTVSISSNGTPLTAIVGKKINMAMQPRVPEIGQASRVASTLGRMKNYSSVVVNLNGSKGVQVNGYEADGSTFGTDATVVSHPDLTGWHEVPVTGLYGIQPLLEISSDRPYPVEVAGIAIDVSVEG